MLGRFAEKIKLLTMARVASQFEVGRGQMLLLLRMAAYLLKVAGTEDSTKVLREELSSVSGGACHGLSIINQVMKLQGEDVHRQWKEILQKITTWDGSRAALAQSVEFPRLGQMTLDKAIDHVLNYLVLTQTYREQLPDFTPKGLSQGNLFNPATRYFEIAIPDEASGAATIHHIQHQLRIVGNLSKDDLMQVLDEEQAEHCIYLLSANVAIDLLGKYPHTIDVSYRSRDKKWIVHNANYEQTNIESREMICDTKKEAVDAIFACMFYSFKKTPPNTLSIEIEIATWDKNRPLSSKRYDQLLANPPVTFFDDKGLSLVLKIRDDLLPRVLDTDTFNTEAGQAAFAKALKTPNMFCGTPLHYLFYYSSDLLFKLLDKPIFQSPVVKQAVEDVLLMKNGEIIRGNRIYKTDLWLKLIENGFFTSNQSKRLVAKKFRTLDGLMEVALQRVDMLDALLAQKIFRPDDFKKITDAQGGTLLHNMASKGQQKVVQWLLDHGSDPHQKNQQGETPVDVAIAAKKWAVVALFARVPEVRKEGILSRLPFADRLKVDQFTSPSVSFFNVSPAPAERPDPSLQAKKKYKR